MSAAKALSAAPQLNSQIDGNDLVLDASGSPPPNVKATIVIIPSPRIDGSCGKEWQGLFNKRAAIGEFGYGLPRDQAEARAFSCCVGKWLQRNPVQSPAGRCALCGRSKGMLLPYLTGYSIEVPGHTWLHQECSKAWHQAHRAKAVAALVAIGIAIPAKFADDFGRNGGE